MKHFKAQHLLRNPLDEKVIVFKNIVQIFDLQNFNQLTRTNDFQDGVYSLCPSQIGSPFYQ